MIKENIKEEIKRLKEEKKQINQKISRLIIKNAECSFCKIKLPLNINKYLKNRYKLAFWNNQKNDKRLICFSCLQYSYNRNLPLISNKKNQVGGWSKKRTFKLYIKKDMFKENKIR